MDEIVAVGHAVWRDDVVAGEPRAGRLPVVRQMREDRALERGEAVDGFGKKPVGAGGHDVAALVVIAAGAEHHVDARAAVHQLRDEVDAGAVWQAGVDDGDGGAVDGEVLARVFEAVGAADPRAGADAHQAEGLGGEAAVLDQKHGEAQQRAGGGRLRDGEQPVDIVHVGPLCETDPA